MSQEGNTNIDPNHPGRMIEPDRPDKRDTMNRLDQAKKKDGDPDRRFAVNRQEVGVDGPGTVQEQPQQVVAGNVSAGPQTEVPVAETLNGQGPSVNQDGVQTPAETDVTSNSLGEMTGAGNSEMSTSIQSPVNGGVDDNQGEADVQQMQEQMEDLTIAGETQSETTESEVPEM